MNLAPTDFWDARSLEQARVYCTMAQLSAAMNERASAFYTKLYTRCIVLVSILTVVAGSQSIPEITSAGAGTRSQGERILAILVAISSVCLGALAGVLSRLDWRGKATQYAKRSVGYARLAGDIRLELTLPARERQPARAFFEMIMAKVAELEDMADPLPSRYRTATQIDQAVLSMWGDTRSVRGAMLGQASSQSNPALPGHGVAPTLHEEGDATLESIIHDGVILGEGTGAGGDPDDGTGHTDINSSERARHHARCVRELFNCV